MILVSDLDGTLLKNETISKEDIEAINAWVSQGNRFWVASGRPVHFVNELNALGLYPEYMLGSTGSAIIHNGQVEVISDISKDDAIDMIHYLDSVDDLDYVIDADTKETYAKTSFGQFFRHMRTNKLKDIREPIDYFKYYDKLLKFFVICANDDIAISVMNYVNEKYSDVFRAYHADYRCLEIVSANTNKWHGLKYLLDKLDISKEELICIGDEGNDIEMIKNAHIGICVSSAKDEVKMVADMIVDSVKEAIEKVENDI